MTEEELQHVIRAYQQRLADAELQAITAGAKLATAQARIQELETEAAAKGERKPAANPTPGPTNA